MTPVRTLEVVQ